MRDGRGPDHERLRRLLKEVVVDIDSARCDPERTIGRFTPSVSTGSSDALERRAGTSKGSKDEATHFFPGVAPYEVLDEVGRGGMGVVFRVQQASLGRQVAVKKLKTKGKSAEADAKRAFLSEALINAQLDHPNIVPVYDLIRTPDGDQALAMKMVEGTCWMDVLHPHNEELRKKAATFTLERHLEILIAVCNAVAFAHSRGIIHRDLKPSNVMLGDYGEILVMDWGMAVSFRSTNDLLGFRLRDRRSIKKPSGSPAYMAPEMTLGDGSKLGPWTDVYLLGGVLYEIITGRRPHDGSSLYDVMKSAYESRPPKFDEGVPSELQDICRTAMARKVRERFQAVEHLQQALRGFLTHRESHTIVRAADDLVREFETTQEQGRRGDYNILPRAIAGYEHARVLWKGNLVATTREQHARWLYAQAAFQAKDYRLARTQLAGISGIPAEELMADIVAAEFEHTRQARTVRTLRRGLAWAAAGLLVVLTVTLILVVRQRSRADQLASESQELARTAETLRVEAERNARLARESEQTARENAQRVEQEAKLRIAALESRATEQKLREETEQQAREAEERARQANQRAHAQEARAEKTDELLKHTTEEAKANEMKARLATDEARKTAAHVKTVAIARERAERESRRLADSKLLDRFEQEASTLVSSKDLVALEQWLHRARELLSRQWDHEEALLTLQRESSERFQGPGKNRADLQALWTRWRELTSHRDSLQDARTEDEQKEHAKTIGRLEREMSPLRERTRASRDYAFSNDDERWQYEVLRDLVKGLETFRAQDYGVVTRVQQALDIALLGPRYSIERHSKEWADATKGIARNPKYNIKDLRPQPGLIPLGQDKESHLYEFLHVASHRGPWPVRDDKGRLAVTEDTGIILVLIPGGRATIGAQKSSSSSPHYDEASLQDEGPVHSVAIDPYLIGKFETTQAQWSRLMGSNPSLLGPDARFANRDHSLLHPVEGVSWKACARLSEFGLGLPTEVQWENAARAGKALPWWTGTERPRIAKGANLADAAFVEFGLEPAGVTSENWNDGWAMHAPVGVFAPNAFGLHDVLGNVREWCRDAFGGYDRSSRAGDGLRDVEGGRYVLRGGTFRHHAGSARLSAREHALPGYSDRLTGVRVAAPLTNETSSADTAWDRASRSISRSGRYARVRLERQSDLMPLGSDPDSGLEEFLHLPTHRGALPLRDAQRHLQITPETGLVFVLVPPLKGKLGTQKADAKAARFYVESPPSESPVHQVEIDSLLVSKYEMTQGQWLRLFGSNPSIHGEGVSSGRGPVTLRNPVEGISLADCERLRVFGLELPTEAQWELFARAGSDALYITGDDASELRGAANLAENDAGKDGYVQHAPVGSFRPNGLGLHDVAGNVAELCRDWFAPYALPVAPATGQRLSGGSHQRVARGGSFQSTAENARVAVRKPCGPTERAPWLGLRPIRELSTR